VGSLGPLAAIGETCRPAASLAERVPGISTVVDMSVFLGSVAELRAIVASLRFRQTLPDGGLALADTDRAPATSIADEVHRLVDATPTRPDSPQAVATTAADITWSGEPPDSKGAAG
jgi:hypothetical protein